MINKSWSKLPLMLRLRCSERLEPSKIFTIALRYISIFFCHACADENSFRGMNKLQKLLLPHAAPRAAAQSRDTQANYQTNYMEQGRARRRADLCAKLKRGKFSND